MLSALSETTVRTMLQSGGATLADVAAHFNLPLSDLYDYCRQHGLRESTLSDDDTIRKLIQAQHPQPPNDWERLLWDDEEGYVINGVDTRTTAGNINADEIIRYYHGNSNCLYTDRPTDLVMAADANQNNILISNLIPIVNEVVAERFKETPTFISHHLYESGPSGQRIKLTIGIEHRFDKLLGTSANRQFLDAVFVRWIRPYFERVPLHHILPYDLPATSELLTVWLWRQLETKALLKGLASLKLEVWQRPTTYLTKQTVLFQTTQMLQRQFGRRNIMTAQPPPLPKQDPRLIKL